MYGLSSTTTTQNISAILSATLSNLIRLTWKLADKHVNLFFNASFASFSCYVLRGNEISPAKVKVDKTVITKENQIITVYFKR